MDFENKREMQEELVLLILGAHPVPIPLEHLIFYVKTVTLCHPKMQEFFPKEEIEESVRDIITAPYYRTEEWNFYSNWNYIEFTGKEQYDDILKVKGDVLAELVEELKTMRANFDTFSRDEVKTLLKQWDFVESEVAKRMQEQLQ